MPTLAELKAKHAPQVGEPTAKPKPLPTTPATIPSGLSLAQLKAQFGSPDTIAKPTPAVADVTRDPRRDARAPTTDILRATPPGETTPLTFVPELGGNLLKALVRQGVGVSEFGGIALKETGDPLRQAAEVGTTALFVDPNLARVKAAEAVTQGLSKAVSLSGRIAATPQKVGRLLEESGEAIAATAATDPAKLVTAPLAWLYENPDVAIAGVSGAGRTAAQYALPAAAKGGVRGSILGRGVPATKAGIAWENIVRTTAEEGPFELGRRAMRDRLFGPNAARAERGILNIKELKASKQSAYAVNTSRVAQQIGEKFKNLTPEDVEHFADYITGIRETPSTASPALLDALGWYRKLGAQQQNDGIRYGLFTMEDAYSRAYQPLRVKAFEEGREAYLRHDPIPSDPLQAEGWRHADQYATDVFNEGGNIKDAESSIAQEIAARKAIGTLPRSAVPAKIKEYNDLIAARLAAAGREQPVYFPNMRSLEKRAEVLGPSNQQTTRYKPGFGKLSTGQTLSENAPKIDPRIVIDRSNRARERYKMHEDILRAIEADAVKARKRITMSLDEGEREKIANAKLASGEAALEPELQAMRSAERSGVPLNVAINRQRTGVSKLPFESDTPGRGPRFGARKLAPGEEPLPSEMLFVPDGFRQFYKKQIDFTDEVTQGLSDGLQMDEAFARAIASQMGVVTEGLGVRSATRIAVPREIGERLKAEFGRTPHGWRVAYDKPIEYWRAAVLALRPAWVMNNIISNTLLTSLQGVAPDSYIKALQKAYTAKMPNEVVGLGGFGSVEGAAHSLDDIIEHGRGASQMVAAALKKVENFPVLSHIGSTADHVRAFNGATEDFFRRASYIHEAQRFARKNYVQRTGDRFFRLYDELQEFDTLKPDQIKKAVQETNFWLNDYVNGLHPFERQFIRRAIPFWSFYRFQARLALQLPVTHPGRATMIRLLAEAGREAAADNELPPAYMGGQGMVDTGHEVPVGDRNMRVFMATGGWNPLLMGQGPQSVGLDPGSSEGGASLSNLVSAIASQGGPFVKYITRSITDRDPFGREFTDPSVVSAPGIGYAQFDVESGKTVFPSKSGPTAKAPEPTAVESVAQNFPQLRLAKAGVTLFARGPDAPTPNWTARPFSMEPSKDPEKAAAFTTALGDLLSYFTGVRLMMVDVEQARKGEARGLVLTPSKARKLGMQGARRRALLRSAEPDTLEGGQ